jgi:hypothetical protein
MSAPERLHFAPRFSWLWHGGTLAVVVAVAVWGAVTQPSPYRWFGLALAVVLVGFALRIVLVRSYLEGSLLVQRGLLRTHRADLARATSVRLRPNRWGSAQLVVEDESGRSAFESLLTTDQYVKVAQPPELLDRIVEALASAPAGSAAGVRKVLARQAEHLRGGGAVEDSPLRPLTRTLTAAATLSDTDE